MLNNVRKLEDDMTDFYKQTSEEVVEKLNVNIDEGLSEEEVEKRLKEYGRNELSESEQRSVWAILLENLNNMIVYLLGFAAILSLFMGDWVEAIAILVAVLISVLTGFFAEYNAQQSVEALQDVVDTTTRVLRDGQEEEIEANKIVPGDILLLREGEAIPADGRLISSNNLAVMESALTGESEPVDKDAKADIEEDEAVGDRINMVFSGTAITRGKGKAVITETGMDTEVGKISDMIDDDEASETPLDKEINQLGKTLIIVAFLTAILVFVIGLFQGQAIPELLQIAVILAVAAIPEAMPAVETITLSNGMNTMAKQRALVKTLPAVETLGSTSVIASDKTGTLTENQMTVQSIIIGSGDEFIISGNGYNLEGDIEHNDEKLDMSVDDELLIDQDKDEYIYLYRLIRDGFLSSDASLIKPDENDSEDEYDIEGDPTDGALTVLGHKIGINDERLENANCKLLTELPFDSERKYMAVLFDAYDDDDYHVIIKGAPDVVLDLANTDEDEREEWQERNSYLAKNGMRVITLARINVEEDEVADVKNDIEQWIEDNLDKLSVDGLFGIVDPPREDVAESIKLTQEAGIAVKMITGDHPDTASYIASDIGIKNAENTMTGKEIDELVDGEEFLKKINETAVFARVSPENKRQLIDAWQDAEEVVAMTGDGVNDAPALSGADIGVAMGVRGTEVAKESADMILTDDQFSTIVKAVEVGRTIFENIKKYVSFLFSCNMVEITTILFTLLVTLPMPLQPLHILFLNLVIDVGPAMSIAFEPAEGDVMKKAPRDKDTGLVNRSFITRIILTGIILGLSSFAIFWFEYSYLGNELEYAQTSTFAFMAVAQLLHVLNVRKDKKFGLDKTLLDNKVLLGALALSLVLLLLAIYLPVMNTVLGTVAIDGIDWLYIVGLAIVSTIVVHLFKSLAGFKS